jgi:hypothetical protein
MADNSCDCEKEVILVPGVGGVPGPAGPQGPQGPPGAGAVFPIPAINISVTNAGYLHLQEVIDELLYVALTINSFSVANFFQNTVEVGASVSSLQFNWALSKLPTTQTLSGPNLTTQNPAPGTTTATVNLNSPLSFGAVGVSYGYTLTVDDGTLTPSANVNLTALNNIYWGDSVIPGSINSVFVNTLNKGLQAGKALTYVSNANTLTLYNWYAVRAALGTPTFTANGFEGGFTLVAPGISVQNVSGFSESYDVYRSVNPAIGPVTIVVT